MQVPFPGSTCHLNEIDGRTTFSLWMDCDMAFRVDPEVTATPAMDSVQTNGILDFPFFSRIRHNRILTRKRKEKATIVVFF